MHILIKLIPLLIFFSLQVSADIKFLGNKVEKPLNVGIEGPSQIDLSFETKFKTNCSPRCGPGQDFRISLSAGSQSGDGYQDYDSIKPEIGTLGDFISGDIKYSVSGNHGFLGSDSFSLGAWSKTMSVTDKQSVFNASLDIKLNRQQLLNHLDGNKEKDFVFYVLAQDVESTGAHNYIEVNVKLKLAEQIQITGLSDVVFTPPPTDDWLKNKITMSFCVYTSNGGNYLMDVRSVNNDDGEFRLLNGSLRSKPHYHLQTKDRRWVSKNTSDLGPYTGSKELNCNGGANNKFTVLLYTSKQYESGNYSDTVEVTVRMQ